MLFYFVLRFILEHMKFWKQLEGAVLGKYFLLLPVFIAVLGATTTLPSLRDQTYEIESVGSAWINDSAILYTQKWSHYSPQTLWVGSLYGNYITSDLAVIVYEALFICLVGLLAYATLKRTNDNEIHNRTLLLLAASALLIPGAWQIGVTPAKLSLLFILSTYFFYFSWKRSSKNYWLFGETAKNWRFALLTGIFGSLTIFTSVYFCIFLLPLIVDFFKTAKKQNLSLLRQISFLIMPVLIEFWVWYSVLSPRRLITDALRAGIIDFKILTNDTSFLVNSWPLMLATLLVASLAIAGIAAKNLRKNPLSWWYSLVVIASLIFIPAAGIQAVLIIIMLSGIIYSNEASRIVRPAFLIAGSFLLLVVSLPLRTTLQKELLLDKTEAALAASYIEQRLVDSRYVYYYGSSAGFYSFSDFKNPTRFYDARIFKYDNPTLQLESKFRGDIEAERPLFVVYATGSRTKAPKIDRLEEYFQKHYEEVANISGYRILKRSSNL